MEVIIKLHGSLRRYRSASVTGAGHRPFTLVVAEGATVGTILHELNIPEETVSAVALNGQQADKGTVLSDRDTVHLFPPAAGGRCSGLAEGAIKRGQMHIFIAGVMQGSRFDGEVHDQGYRERIIAALRRQLPNAHVTDPWSLEPESASYDGDRLRKAFLKNTALAGEADLLIAYLPHASMGTAIELWTAYHGRAYVIAVTPMTRNWVVQITADKVLPDLECLLDYIQSGRLGEELKMRLIRRSPVDDQEPAV